ncbi:cysteine-rich RLK (RECEPTOR-like protein kinase) 8 [Hibiscus trionum]|uniref:Cysteine-rich RLK (RECEPTOR-like protein kinase) 8 n=1 Tax=Hibiscus trionum TaxID=183268 RepID=A0A9W7MIR0_HIBTR|nr:cysteine-rich RLK (RECEPTOR-like protein kinase) 8 [Hibiscus trionum]
MKQPPGYEVKGFDGQELVCKLQKAIYGLKQAPRAWFDTLKTFLTCSLGFVASKSDCSLFTRFSTSSSVLLMVFVDDIIVTGNDSTELDRVVQQLHAKISLKDLGSLSFFSGHGNSTAWFWLVS